MKLRDLLPNRLKSLLLRRFFRTPRACPAGVRFKVAGERWELEQAYALLHDSYVGHRIMKPQPSGLRCNLYSALPSTCVLAAIAENRVIATVSLIRDSGSGLPSDRDYKKENDSHRGQGRRLVEVSGMAVDRDFRRTRSGTDVNIYLMNFLRRIAFERLGGDTLVAVVHPRAEVFYSSLFAFRRTGQITRYDQANGALACHLSTSASEIHAHMKAHFQSASGEKDLFSLFHEQRIEEFEFPKSMPGVHVLPVLTAEDLGYFFETRTALFHELSGEELRRIRSAYEPYFDLGSLDSMKIPELHPQRSRRPRLPTWIPAVTGGPSSAGHGWIKDLSASGCLIQAHETLPVGTKLSLQFSLNATLILLAGTVVRIQSREGQPESAVFAVEFDSPSERIGEILGDTHLRKPALRNPDYGTSTAPKSQRGRGSRR